MGGLDGHVGAAPLLWETIVLTLRDIPHGPICGVAALN